MPYGSLLTDTVQSSTAGTPPQFNDGNGTQVGTLCRAWVNFNGVTTATIRASFNVSSITRNTTGDYTVNFTTAMTDANYSVLGSTTTPGYNSATGSLMIMSGLNAGTPDIFANSTSAVRIRTAQQGISNSFDSQYVCVGVFR